MKLVLVGAWIGCSTGDAPDGGTAATTDDSDRPTESDSDGDTDTDADGDGDTDGDGDSGVALLWHHLEGEVRDGVWIGGRYGTWITALPTLPSFDALLCDNTGVIVSAEPAPCPECDWAFTFRIGDTTADGERCDDFGRTGGEWDGQEVTLGYTSDGARWYDYTTRGSWQLLWDGTGDGAAGGVVSMNWNYAYYYYYYYP